MTAKPIATKDTMETHLRPRRDLAGDGGGYLRLVSFVLLQLVFFAADGFAQRGQPPGPPPTPRAAAPIDRKSVV